MGVPAKFRSLLLNEMISSSHGTSAISSMLRKVKEAYESKYNQTLSYRLICTDYSWAAMHAIIETLNQENIITYSNKVFYMASLNVLEELHEMLKKGTWITSCTSHTMKHFVNIIRGFGVDPQTKDMCIYAFS